MNKILVPHGVRKQIMEAFDISYPTVRKALNGSTNTPIARRIRKSALNNGGIEIEILQNKD